jgi:hypothetical protein
MSDAIFHTLMAALVICVHHYSGPLDDGFLPTGAGQYEHGFAQCAVIAAAIRAETTRRADVAAEKQVADDKADIANALAALHGKPFKPQAPTLPAVPGGGQPDCIEPTLTVH